MQYIEVLREKMVHVKCKHKDLALDLRRLSKNITETCFPPFDPAGASHFPRDRDNTTCRCIFGNSRLFTSSQIHKGGNISPFIRVACLTIDSVHNTTIYHAKQMGYSNTVTTIHSCCLMGHGRSNKKTMISGIVARPCLQLHRNPLSGSGAGMDYVRV